MFTQKPYSEQWIYNLLVSSCGVQDKRSLTYLRGIAKTGRKAYLVGQRERQSGAEMVKEIDSANWLKSNCIDSDLTKTACEFVYQMYRAGYLTGKEVSQLEFVGPLLQDFY